MFNRICNKIAGGVVGFVEGFVLGPFAAVGKWYAMFKEEEIEAELKGEDDLIADKNRSSGFLWFIPFVFIGGFIYGAIRGAIIGYQEGLHKGTLKNIAKEMFTYDPFYSDIITAEVCNKIPESIISYRKFREAGLLSSTQNVSGELESTPLISTAKKDSFKINLFHYFSPMQPPLKTSDSFHVLKM